MKKMEYIQPNAELIHLPQTLSLLDTLSQPDEFGINDWTEGEIDSQTEDIY